MSVAGLFSGIGGFELACRHADIHTNLLVENDPAARSVLKTQFPNADIREDVFDLTDLPIGTRMITAGFPCQNLSMAGDKSGLDGSKSAVVKKLFELISATRIPVVIIENVYFMLQLDSGRAMQWLVEQFEALGYQWAYRVLDSMGFGLPQRRRRVYFVASTEIDPRTVLFADNTAARERNSIPGLEKPLGFYWTEGRSGIGLTVDGIPPLKVGSSLGIPSAPAVLFPDGEVLMPSIGTCELLQGFPRGWTRTERLDSTARNPQWRMLGNAVSVPVVKWLTERIKTPGTLLNFEQRPLQEKRRWPEAAWNTGDGRVTVTASDTPVLITPPSITTFRDSSWTRLSNRALDGFIGRALKGKLWTPEGFLEALQRAPRKPSSREPRKPADN